LIAAIRALSSARSPRGIAQIVKRTARALVGADGATFVLLEGNQCFYLEEDAISPLWKGQRFPLEDCISGWVMLNQQQVAIEDVFGDARIPHAAYQPTFVKSLVMTPVRREPAAAIGVYWAKPHGASAEERTLLQDLADATAEALDNAAAYSELERRAERRTQELMAANRELETFSYSVAHDLRSPLTCIVGFADLLERRYAVSLGPKGQEILREIVRSGQTMSTLIDGLLSLAQQARGSLKREPVDLTAIAERVVASLHAQQPARAVACSIEPNLNVEGDSTLLELVLSNLLGNAFKYTGKVERPEVRLARAPEQADTFVVQDNGAGFEAARAGRLFAPFQRLHQESEFPGTGVGLATVARIVRKHGGSVWAEGEEGKGASFFFSVPHYDP